MSGFKKLSFAPWHLSVCGIALLLCLPLMWNSGAALNLLSQICIASVLGLSFNMLLGQTGMLSFGHAVYSGLGAFVAVHAMNKISDGSLVLPLSLLPLLGGVAGAFFGAVFGWISTKKSGITFSMISLGIGELVFACSLMFPGFFGGEGGISANRVAGATLWGISFGPQIQVVYLILVWSVLSGLAMFYLRSTALGKLAAAVRDNPERVAFIGFDPRQIRWIMMVWSSFFAGVAGALAAINFELVTAENLSAVRSGAVLLFSYVGGIAVFLGPVLGALFGVFATVVLSEITQAWQFYTGLLFILIVLYMPSGLAGLVLSVVRAVRVAIASHRLTSFLMLASQLVLAISIAAASLIAMVELVYQMRLGLSGVEAFKTITQVKVQLFSYAFEGLSPSIFFALGVAFLLAVWVMRFFYRKIQVLLNSIPPAGEV